MTTSFAAPATKPPNIVFSLADELGHLDIGANNPKTFYETPDIDDLARQGRRFTQGYAACSVCSPTRASSMTGKDPARDRVPNFMGGKRTSADEKEKGIKGDDE